ncbi:aminotransferase class I/II-fold pyridoxal phosphate-dependent enzyme [Candidatus Fermentibacteria bacterium]|nr:aminotransferase class I/II-fold pyridoxal phosphate-dependent enzyme [Candidatus Fermentibacteria bacterium]
MFKTRETVRQAVEYVPPVEGRRGMLRLDFNECADPLSVAIPTTADPSVYPEYDSLLRRLAEAWELPRENLMLLNGSGEGLFVTAFCFVEPGATSALVSDPTFALIPHCLEVAGAGLVKVRVTEELRFDTQGLEKALEDEPDVVVLASPDNPTGAVLPPGWIEGWCEKLPGTLFVIDEAYSEYTGKTVLPLTRRLENLIVLRTFSKAWGLAGLRLGAAAGPPELLAQMRKVRLPYSVNSAAVSALLSLLPQRGEVLGRARETAERRGRLAESLRQRGLRVFEGRANFVLVDLGERAGKLCEFCRRSGILIRDRSYNEATRGMVRITVGTSSQNDFLVECIEAFLEGGEPPRARASRSMAGIDRGRSGSYNRKTRETELETTISLGGPGTPRVDVEGLPFLGHMLEAFAVHGRFGLSFRGSGDTEVDPHHLVEDCGIVLGKAVRRALGGSEGIERSGWSLFPMDESLARVALDLSGRPGLVWDVDLAGNLPESVDPRVFEHFFQGLSRSLRATIHVRLLQGGDDHHSLEAIFKSLGKALRQATALTAEGAVPSSKGALDD